MFVMKRRETFNSWEVLFSFLNSVWKLDGSLEPQPLRRAYMPGEIDGMGASSLGWNRFRRDSVGFRFSLFLSCLPFSSHLFRLRRRFGLTLIQYSSRSSFPPQI